MVKVHSVQQVRRTGFLSGYNRSGSEGCKNSPSVGRTSWSAGDLPVAPRAHLMRPQKASQSRVDNLRMFKKRNVCRVFDRQKLGPGNRRQDLLAHLERHVPILFPPYQQDRRGSDPEAYEILRPIRRQVVTQRRKQRPPKPLVAHLRAVLIGPIRKLLRMQKIILLTLWQVWRDRDRHEILPQERRAQLKRKLVAVRKSRVE